MSGSLIRRQSARTLREFLMVTWVVEALTIEVREWLDLGAIVTLNPDEE